MHFPPFIPGLDSAGDLMRQRVFRTANPYPAQSATNYTAGIVQPDGVTLAINANGLLYVIGGGGGGGAVNAVNSVNFPGSPALNTVPVVTAANQVTYQLLQNVSLSNANYSVTLTGNASGTGNATLGNQVSIPVVTLAMNGVSYPNAPSLNTVPVITSANQVTYEQLPLAAMAFNSITVTNDGNVTANSSVTLGGTLRLGFNTNVAATNLVITQITGTANPVYQPAVYGSIVNVNDGATININCQSSNKFQVLGNTTVGNTRNLSLQNASNGQQVMLKFIQNSTPNQQINTVTNVNWPGNTSPTLTAVANHYDWLGFVCTNSAANAFDGFPVGLNFA
jgi:hypothetical protein